jgi:uncharacterized protein
VLDLARIVGFDWDEGNVRKSLDKYGISQKEAEEVFVAEPLIVAEDVKHSQSEERYQALGQSLKGRQLHVTFTLREEGTKIRVISCAQHEPQRETSI